MNKELLFLENLSLFLSMGYTFEESIELIKDFIPVHQYHDIQQLLIKGYAPKYIISHINLSDRFIRYYSFFKEKNTLSHSIDKSLYMNQIYTKFTKLLTDKLTYPSILMIFLLIFSLFLHFFLLPAVLELFLSFQIEITIFISLIYSLFRIIPVFIFMSIFVLSVFLVILLYALKKQKIYIIDIYLKNSLFKKILSLYFSLKFAIYYNAFIKEGLDHKEIIEMLNEILEYSDIKFIFYDLLFEMNKGKNIFQAISEQSYFDSFFITAIHLSMQNHQDILDLYIDITMKKIDMFIKKFLRIIVPSIYIFIGMFVIGVYATIVIPLMNIIGGI